MYKVILGNIDLPIAPSKLEITCSGRNDTVNLIDGSQVSIIRSPALREISFDFILPHQEYPFENASEGDRFVYPIKGLISTGVGELFKVKRRTSPSTGETVWGNSTLERNNYMAFATDVLKKLEAIMVEKKPIDLSIMRYAGNKGIRVHEWQEDMKVTLENYTVTEDADNGFDVVVSVNLKEYREVKTEILNKGVWSTITSWFD